MSLTHNHTVLFAGGDPGGSRAVLECYSNFINKGFKCFVLKHGWINQYLDISMSTIDPKYTEIEIIDCLKSNHIDVLVFGTSLTDTLPLCIARCAEKLNIPTICILDNWMNYRERLEIDQLPFFIPTIYAVMDSIAAQGAIASGIPSSCVHITGHPALSSLYEQYTNFKNHSASDHKNKILFVSEPVSEDQGTTPLSTKFRGYTQQKVLKLVCNAFQPFYNKFTFILLPHPRENKEILFQIWNEFKGKLDGEISNYPSGREAVLSVDRVIGMSSILLYEAWLVGKPVISIQPNLLISDLKTISLRQGVFFVDDIISLETKIEQWLRTDCILPRSDLSLHCSAAENVVCLAVSLLSK